MAKVYAWNERKKRFSPRQIGIAFQTLQNKVGSRTPENRA
jgi:hypothetical protein